MVKAWKEIVTIPTYEVGKPEKNPVFLENRVYQGSSGAVYPYPVIESISNEKIDKDYQAVWLENEYIKLMILPQLGGRVQMAYDKIAGRHFIYYNRVIKPALVGLAGPWISGGIEFNWPQHHRPSTFMPVDCTIEEFPDGSVTVWCNEIEIMSHQKGMAGFTLYPGRAYLEIKGVLYNPTKLPQSFLWWANPAVKVNDAYQSVFPPDVNAVFDHGKRAVSTFPVATGVYYKMDYSAGVDISNYKNIFVPTSYMVAASRFDFEGGYENDTRAGMLHVANHHFAPGKKQWTWGNGDFGRAWDRNLTDEDGPYIELMAGVYTENQPDFSWLMPNEEKSFTQYFFPYRELGVVKNADKDLVMNVDPAPDGKLRLRLYASSAQNVHILICDDNSNTLCDKSLEMSPEAVFDELIAIGDIDFDKLTIKVNNLTWHAEPKEGQTVPAPAQAALKPKEIDTCEQLYLTGLHLEQYRHATWSALDYYEEALRRDPSDLRNNNAIGLWYIRRGRFDKAEPYLRTAVKVLQQRNLNPYDGEPLFNLGLCLYYQERFSEAYDWFYKAAWNAAWQDSGYYACAGISAREARFTDALDELDHSLRRNYHNHNARALKVLVLHKLGRDAQALALAKESLEIDKFNFAVRWAAILIDGPDSNTDEFAELMRDAPENYNETALFLQACGFDDEANALWQFAESRGAVNIMSYYYWGRYDKAAATDTACVFPNRLEAVLALRKAIKANPSDAKAQYLLGSLFYDKRQYDLAIVCWEKSAEFNPAFPTVWRNLALVYYNKVHNSDKALEFMEKAYSLDEDDARVLMELDQLYKKLGRPYTSRLEFLQKHSAQLIRRDDLVLEEITLLNQTGEYQQAKAKLDAHLFHPWEGGEGKVPEQYQISRMEIAKSDIDAGRYESAIVLLEECLVYPPNLGEGKLFNAQEQDFYYYLGLSWKGLGRNDKALECWTKGSKGNLEPLPALYYNDAKPEKIFYQGLCLAALGRCDEAEVKFRKLIDYGRTHADDEVVMDYFAVSLPDLAIWDEDVKIRNRNHCKKMLSLGEEGLGLLPKNK